MNAIDFLLRRAAIEAGSYAGRVTVFTQMQLAAEGYELDALEDDIANLNETEN